jgi:hypothetical protein
MRLVPPWTSYIFINYMQRSQDYCLRCDAVWSGRCCRTIQKNVLSLRGRTRRPCIWKQHVPAVRASYLKRCLPASWSSKYTVCTQAALCTATVDNLVSSDLQDMGTWRGSAQLTSSGGSLAFMKNIRHLYARHLLRGPCESRFRQHFISIFAECFNKC